MNAARSAANENRPARERVEAMLWAWAPLAWAALVLIAPLACAVSLIRWAGGF